MKEDAPTSAKHGHRSCVGGMFPGELIVKIELIECQLDEFSSL
jgi:hypothetical protein